MPGTLVDAASRLGWALRRYAWLVVLIAAGTVGVALLTAPVVFRAGAPVYRTSALVVATDLEIRADQLPRLANAVFTGGTVAELAVRRGRLPYEPTELIPEHARVEPVEDNIVLLVEGIAPEPELAARIANSAAQALVDRLNQAGPGVGVFAVQDVARVPLEPDPAPSLPVLAAVALLAGLTLALGLVGLLMVLRRPVLTATEAGAATGAPVLGAPALPPPRRRRPVEPQTVVGLAAFVKQLYPERSGAAVFVSVKGGDAARHQVAVLVARVLARFGPVYLIPARERDIPSLARFEQEGVSALRAQDAGVTAFGGRPAVIEGPTAAHLDIPQFLPPDARTVLVVPEGASQAALESAARQFLPGELLGVAFVERRRGRVRSPRRRAPGTQRPARREPITPADAEEDVVHVPPSEAAEKPGSS